ncbi:hypothetical protein OF001_U160018 [Pseudomonas sp. OF001]|nr:hypothetical protein OF001_U160018 [Pseudomonas sp. OF001]
MGATHQPGCLAVSPGWHQPAGVAGRGTVSRIERGSRPGAPGCAHPRLHARLVALSFAAAPGAHPQPAAVHRPEAEVVPPAPDRRRAAGAHGPDRQTGIRRLALGQLLVSAGPGGVLQARGVPPRPEGTGAAPADPRLSPLIRGRPVEERPTFDHAPHAAQDHPGGQRRPGSRYRPGDHRRARACSHGHPGLLGVPARPAEQPFRADGHRRPQQGLHRPGQHGAQRGPGRPGRHPRGAAQPRGRLQPPALPLLRRDRRGALRLLPRRADHPPPPGDGRAGGAAEGAPPVRRGRGSLPGHHERPARRGDRPRRSDRLDPRPRQAGQGHSRHPLPRRTRLARRGPRQRRGGAAAGRPRGGAGPPGRRHRRRDRLLLQRRRGGAKGHARAVRAAGQPAAPGGARAVRRLPDDARRRLDRRRSHQGHRDRPVGPGRPAPGGQRPCAALRADGRRLPQRARLGHQGHRPAHPRLSAAGPPAEAGLPGQHHPGQRGAVAGDARRGAARQAGRPGLGDRLEQLARRHPRPRHGHPHGDGRGRPALHHARRHRADRRRQPRRRVHQPLSRPAPPVQRDRRGGAPAQPRPRCPAQPALRDHRRPPHAAVGQHRAVRRHRPRPGARCRGRRPVPQRSAVHDQRALPQREGAGGDLPRPAQGLPPAAGDHAHPRHRRRQGAVLLPDQGREPLPRLARHPRHPRPPGDLPGPGARHAQGQRGPGEPAHPAADDQRPARTGGGAAPLAPRLERGARGRRRRAHAAGGGDDRDPRRGVPDPRTGPPGRLPVGRLQRPDPVPAGGRPQQPAGGQPLRLPAPVDPAGAQARGRRCTQRRQAGEHLRRDGRRPDGRPAADGHGFRLAVDERHQPAQGEVAAAPAVAGAGARAARPGAGPRPRPADPQHPAAAPAQPRPEPHAGAGRQRAGLSPARDFTRSLEPRAANPVPCRFACGEWQWSSSSI